MANIFNIGDKVERTKGDNYPEYNMYKGNIYTVKESGIHRITFEEATNSYDSDFFKLALK